MAFSTYNTFVSRKPKSVVQIIYDATATSMNIISWYNPANVTFSSGNNVATWPDSMSQNNLTMIGAAGTIVQSSSTLLSLTSGSYFSCTPKPTGIHSILFNSSTAANKNNTYSNQIYSLSSGDYGVRNNNLNNSVLNANDYQYNCSPAATYLNGTNYQSGNKISGMPTLTYPTENQTSYIGINSTYATGSTLSLGNYNSSTFPLRNFAGNIGHFFLLNASFTTAQQQWLEGYLGYVYSTQSKLPSTHPYYSAKNNIKFVLTSF